ncbi:nitrite reductase small subunit NirD [Sulfitobacter donghicola]|uniref:tRNA-(Guanine-N1)-methyltransferase n=1 Tax=Sulfitobacter donghicola DSW-25 = KCTC 12864 = JCM 14565 TaxID=1300350 RepID=A0A073ITG0_9RHOB|nr:nitrite reductase small subunit NirD [Sulfitobacter donghicola]KEJ88697.1 tRNA-(guanine-N1)-methyltransferase [Sulfitobacter donghicola DSW-25 = KCTC 12864 = JCM 14565]KIN68471.1 Nitrite reductase (NAD(P)H), small subunit [Sulfitobacter donghicola DSW-25 = KCTC 12864 = JCM 14565]
MSDWINIAALDAVPQRGARLIKTAHGCVAVFRTSEDKVFALDNACPHKKGPLADGIVHGSEVTCPLHNWVISLETGKAQGADEGQVATYPARVEDGCILLDVAFLKQRAVA